MECPVCGCRVDIGEGEPAGEVPVECGCCGTVWLVAGRALDRILVGPEG